MKRKTFPHRLPLFAVALVAALGAIPLAVAGGGGGPPAGIPAEKLGEFAQAPPGPDDKRVLKARPVADAEPPWRTGIIESGLAPFPAAEFTFENQWQNVAKGHHVNVYVGSDAEDAAQGVVVVERTTLDGASSDGPDVYTAPGAVGSLRIVSARGVVLTLQSASGETFTFNVESGDFRSS
jgi:hypothetical protein